MKLRFTSVFAIFFVIAHAIAAVVLCRERLFLDLSYYFFHVVNEQSFRIEHQRIILALSQSLLLTGVWLHLSLTTLLRIYSITPVLYSALLIFVSLRYFRSEATAWLIMITNVCGAMYLYYSPMYEVSYAAISFSFLWLLTEKRFYQSPLQILIYVFLLAMVLFGYPLMIIGILCMLAYHCLQHWRMPVTLILIYVLAIGAWCAVKYFLISDYEKGKVSVSPNEYHGILKTMLSPHFAKEALTFLFKTYTAPMIALIIFVASVIRRRRYFTAIFAVLSIVAYVFIVNFSYRGSGLIHSNNFERMYLLLIPLCMAPFTFYIYPRMNSYLRALVIALAAVLCINDTTDVWHRSGEYTQRLTVLHDLYQPYADKGCTKAAVNWEAIYSLNEWSTGMEALIYSSEKGRSIILSDVEMVNQKKALLDRNHFVLRLDEIMSNDELNHRYFKIDSADYCY
jgi:hypothetical protein